MARLKRRSIIATVGQDVQKLLSTTFSVLVPEKKENELPIEFEKLYVKSDEKLGAGAFAEVYKGTRKEDDLDVAIKIFTLDKLKDEEREMRGIRAEIKCLQLTDHPNIVKMFDSFEDEKHIVVVMEYLEGKSLYEKMMENQLGFCEADVQYIVSSLACALNHCNSKGIIHRDVKPQNVVYCVDGTIKLIDFNLSYICDPSEVCEVELDEPCGTARYVAPEIANSDDYGYKIDIWSLGVLTYVCSSGGYLPFSTSANTADELEEILDKVEDGQWLFEPKHAWAKVSDLLKDIISGMLMMEPNDRLTYKQITDHKFMTHDENQFNLIDIKNFHQNLIFSRNKISMKKKKHTKKGAWLFRMFNFTST